MKKALLILILALATATVFNACTGRSTKSTEQKVKVEYTCPMHPEIIRYEPGKCPKCGMDLVEKKVEQKQDTIKK